MDDPNAFSDGQLESGNSTTDVASRAWPLCRNILHSKSMVFVPDVEACGYSYCFGLSSLILVCHFDRVLAHLSSSGQHRPFREKDPVKYCCKPIGRCHVCTWEGEGCTMW